MKKRVPSKLNLRFSPVSQKRAVSTIVASVFVVMLSVFAVAILFTFVMPTVNDNLQEAAREPVELSIQTSGGYTIWDETNKLAKVQIRRGNDNTDLEGVRFQFIKETNTIEYTSEDTPSVGQVKTYSFILGDFGKPEGIKITAIVDGKEVEVQGTPEIISDSSNGGLKTGTGSLTGAITIANLTFGDHCASGNQCESSFCVNTLCTNESGQANGWTTCSAQAECLGGFCGAGICSDGSDGETCNLATECLGGYCGDNICSDGSEGDYCDTGEDGDCIDGLVCGAFDVCVNETHISGAPLHQLYRTSTNNYSFTGDSLDSGVVGKYVRLVLNYGSKVCISPSYYPQHCLEIVDWGVPHYSFEPSAKVSTGGTSFFNNSLSTNIVHDCGGGASEYYYIYDTWESCRSAGYLE